MDINRMNNQQERLAGREEARACEEQKMCICCNVQDYFMLLLNHIFILILH